MSKPCDETRLGLRSEIAIAISLGVVLTAALGWQPVLVSGLTGVVLMVLTGCLKPGEVYSAVPWELLLFAGRIPLGVAMDNSGATQWLADNLVALGSGLSGYWFLVFFYFITVLLTELLSNNLQ